MAGPRSLAGSSGGAKPAARPAAARAPAAMHIPVKSAFRTALAAANSPANRLRDTQEIYKHEHNQTSVTASRNVVAHAALLATPDPNALGDMPVDPNAGAAGAAAAGGGGDPGDGSGGGDDQDQGDSEEDGGDDGPIDPAVAADLRRRAIQQQRGEDGGDDGSGGNDDGSDDSGGGDDGSPDDGGGGGGPDGPQDQAQAQGQQRRRRPHPQHERRERREGDQDDGSQDDGQDGGSNPDDDALAALNDDSAADADDGSGDADINGDAGQAGGPRFHAQIHGGRLYTLGVVPTQFGSVPMVIACSARGKPDGQVRIGADVAVDAAVERSMQAIMDKQQTETMRKACEELVERARAGDQNAFATIDMVRQNAKKADPRARISHGFIAEYIRTHPIDGATNIGSEPNMRAAVALANGPPLTKDRVQAYVSTFGHHSNGRKTKRLRGAMMHGISSFGAECDPQVLVKLDAIERNLLELGRTVGMALRIQRTRSPNAPIGPYFNGAAWELGE